MTSKSTLPRLLSGTGLFRDQPADVLTAAVAMMQERRHAAGTQIFARGDPGDSLFLILSGRVRISILTPDGRELSFSHAVAGDIVGEIAVLDGSPRSANATALSDVTALRLSAQDFNRLIDWHPSLARAAIRLLCRRLRELSDHLEDIALLPLPARLARFFLNRLDGQPGGRLPGTAARVSLNISQGELALLVGASRPKVNAALMTLAQAGAVVRDGNAFVCDPLRLADLAQREE
jgi:CRP-like cAMP-binding protein